MPHLQRDCAHPVPHLHRDWTHPVPTSAPGLLQLSSDELLRPIVVEFEQRTVSFDGVGKVGNAQRNA